jgi:hypothetical protein
MARPARHVIELSEEERVMLERRARAEKLPFQDVQRARIVPYAAEGRADTKIAARLDISSGLVGRWRRRAVPAGDRAGGDRGVSVVGLAWLHEDAIKPWQQQWWIYRRAPEFAAKAGAST